MGMNWQPPSLLQVVTTRQPESAAAAANMLTKAGETVAPNSCLWRFTEADKVAETAGVAGIPNGASTCPKAAFAAMTDRRSLAGAVAVEAVWDEDGLATSQ